MSTTVTAGGLTMTSTSESAEAITSTLSSEKPESPEPRVLVDKGVPVDPEKEKVSQAASELGKKGGEAAAAARKLAAKDARRDGAGRRDPEPEPAEIDEAEEARRHVAAEIEAEPDVVKRKQLASERVQEATRRAAEERRRADALEAEVQRLRTYTRPQEAPQPPRPEAQEPPQPTFRAEEPPREEDFENYADFVRATIKHEHQVQAQAQQRERFAHEYAAKEIQGIETFRSKVAEVIKTDPSKAETVIPFRDVLQNSSHGVPPGQRPTAFNVLNDEILRSDNPVPLMEHLKANPDVVRSILDLTTREAIARKMERIQASLEGAPTGTPPAKRAVSKAPPPIPPVTGSPHTADSEPGPEAPYDAHRAYWSRKDRERSAQR